MKNQKYVLVSHKEFNARTFLFKIKKCVKVKIGDVVICETMRGQDIGFVKEIIQSPEILENELVRKFDAYQPLKEIIFSMPRDIYNLIISNRQVYLSRAKYYAETLVEELKDIEKKLKG